jgi:hypothetical protein
MRVELAWVDALLSRWGRWAIRCESGALGFASSCSIGGGDLHTNEDGHHSAEPRGLTDDDMEAVDGAVRKLPPILRITIIEVYQHGQGKSDRQQAEALGVDRKTLCKYVLLAHRKIALDISIQCPQNHAQSANRGSCLESNQPVTAIA